MKEDKIEKSLKAKAFPWIVGITISLIGIIYGFLIKTDVEARTDINTLQSQYNSIATNVWILCKKQSNECINPDSLVK